MQVLITGAFGFVGSHLAPFLASKGHVCDALDLTNGHLSSYRHVYTWEQLTEIPWEQYDAVIHLAGKAHDLRNVATPEVYTEINFALTKRLYETLSERVRAFLFFSSVKAVADHLEHGQILTEESFPAPKTPYGLSKQAAESFLLSAGGTTRKIILRPAMIYGPGNKGNLNALYHFASKPIPWPLAAFQNARSFAYIGNVCAAVEALLTSPHAPTGIYHVADDETLSVNELITLIAHSLGRKPHLWPLPKALMTWGARLGSCLHLPLNSERLGKLTESYCVSNAKLKQTLHWEAMPYSAQHAFETTFNSFREASNGHSSTLSHL